MKIVVFGFTVSSSWGNTSDHRACALTAALESARTSARVPPMAEA
jgi:hypothetical protein